jgi:hypothetical protein
MMLSSSMRNWRTVPLNQIYLKITVAPHNASLPITTHLLQHRKQREELYPHNNNKEKTLSFLRDCRSPLRNLTLNSCKCKRRWKNSKIALSSQRLIRSLGNWMLREILSTMRIRIDCSRDYIKKLRQRIS